jgi:hypothetical protein
MVTSAFAHDEDSAPACQPTAQLPLGFTRTQTLRLNATCVPTDEHDGNACRVTLRFLDADGVPLVNPDVPGGPAELTIAIPVRGVAAVELPGDVFVGGGLRTVVKAVATATERDFNADRIATNVEVLDTATGRADIRYAFQGCRTLPFAFVPRAQRPAGFHRPVQEMTFAPPGITLDEAVSLNAACAPDASRPHEPCKVVLRYSRFENASGPHAGANPLIAERALTIQPGAIGSFELPGSALGATAARRAMFRPSVVGHPDVLRRIVTSLEFFDAASGVAHSLYQPQIKIRPPVLLR